MTPTQKPALHGEGPELPNKMNVYYATWAERGSSPAAPRISESVNRDADA
jgi:hypothetical protein